MATLDADGFWSYAHADDGAESGRIRRLATLLCEEYALLTATGLRLFLDRDDLAWGDTWQDRIDRALAGVTFFIPVITPRYFQSVECRRELLTFATHARALGVSELLLPIHYVNVQKLESPEDDEAMKIVSDTQWFDWRSLRLEDEASPDHRAGVNELAQRLVGITEQIGTRPAQSMQAADGEFPEGQRDAEPGEPGIIDLLAEAEEKLPQLVKVLEGFGAVMTRITEITEAAAVDLAATDAARRGFAGRLRAASRYAANLAQPADDLLALGSRYASTLVEVDPGILTLISLAGTAEDPDDRKAACELFTSIKGMAAQSRESVGQMKVFSDTVQETAGFSRDLRTPLRKIQDGIRGFTDGQGIIDEWVRHIDNSALDCSKVEIAT